MRSPISGCFSTQARSCALRRSVYALRRTFRSINFRRSVPIGPELHRALDRYFAQRVRKRVLAPTEPLFRSRFPAADGAAKPIIRSMAEKIIKRAFHVISDDTQGLSSHSLRKSWAMRLYEVSGHDLLIVRDGLGHRSVAVTQIYLPTARARVETLLLKTDWTHRQRRRSEAAA